MHHHIGALVRTIWHCGVQPVGQGRQQGRGLPAQRIHLLLQPFHIRAQAGALGFQHRGIAPRAFECPYLPRKGFAAGLLVLQQGLGLTLFLIPCEQLRRDGGQPPAGQIRIKRGGVGS